MPTKRQGPKCNPTNNYLNTANLQKEIELIKASYLKIPFTVAFNPALCP